ncbi:MAG: molybdenum cofactor guanylyltransferase MobA [Acidovorax sp.]
MIDTQHITGLVLAGGRGARMGGLDKGLQLFRGLPLAQHALRRLQPQVGNLLLNANRNLTAYAAFGVPVWPDAQADYPGPLAGFLAGLTHCTTPWLLTAPCDTPLFPSDLAARLAEVAEREGSDIAMAAGPEPDAQGQPVLRPQPVFCLLRATLRQGLAEHVAAGGSKVRAWAQQQRCSVVPFDRLGDAPDAFANANTLAELQALQSPTD